MFNYKSNYTNFGDRSFTFIFFVIITSLNSRFYMLNFDVESYKKSANKTIYCLTL